uniref:Uncharacterized protein n=1 Tax=Anopheles coluzzii TaxID=1518534 RepID=A0A8W7PPW2_ANOCL
MLNQLQTTYQDSGDGSSSRCWWPLVVHSSNSPPDEGTIFTAAGMMASGVGGAGDALPIVTGRQRLRDLSDRRRCISKLSWITVNITPTLLLLLLLLLRLLRWRRPLHW